MPPTRTDVTVQGQVNVDKFPRRLSTEYQVVLEWVVIMDGNRGFWIHAGDTTRDSSAGCINLHAHDAKAVYDWIDGRTRITVSAPWLQA